MSAGTALITGVSGQDGSYMAEQLTEQGWRVVGTSRDPSGVALPKGVVAERWDLRDDAELRRLIEAHRPSRIFNFAAYSTGTGMYDDPVGIAEVNGLAVARILEAIQAIDPRIRFAQASSAEMFGEPAESPQNEGTPFGPRSPYGAAKLYAHNLIGIYRRRYGLFACSAILFNHESPRRGPDFVTRKIAHAAAAISLGKAEELALGNLEARRDWSFAGDSVRAMRLMLEAEAPDDYVIATGETHSVRELCEIAFARVDLDYRDYVRASAEDFRPAEARQLVGDPAKAARMLGWRARMPFAELVTTMVDAELRRLGGSRGLQVE